MSYLRRCPNCFEKYKYDGSVHRCKSKKNTEKTEFVKSAKGAVNNWAGTNKVLRPTVNCLCAFILEACDIIEQQQEYISELAKAVKAAGGLHSPTTRILVAKAEELSR